MIQRQHGLRHHFFNVDALFEAVPQTAIASGVPRLLSPMSGAIPAIPIESPPPDGFHSRFGERN